MVTGEIVDVTPEVAAVIDPPKARPSAKAARGRSRAAVEPVGLAIGADVGDIEGWGCAACGSPPDGPLRTTIQDEIRRGRCPSCDRDKPFMRGL